MVIAQNVIETENITSSDKSKAVDAIIGKMWPGGQIPPYANAHAKYILASLLPLSDDV